MFKTYIDGINENHLKTNFTIGEYLAQKGINFTPTEKIRISQVAAELHRTRYNREPFKEKGRALYSVKHLDCIEDAIKYIKKHYYKNKNNF